MESFLNRYRNLTVLLVVIVGQLLLLAYQVKSNQEVRLNSRRVCLPMVGLLVVSPPDVGASLPHEVRAFHLGNAFQG